MAKWLWRFGIELNSLWCSVVMARCGVYLKWKSRDVKRRHGCGIWKSIMIDKLDFWKFFRFSIGSRVDISFWEDCWIGEVTLKECFNGILCLVSDPWVSVVDSFDSLNDAWIPRLRRNLNDWEMSELVKLMYSLSNHRPELNRGDS